MTRVTVEFNKGEPHTYNNVPDAAVKAPDFETKLKSRVKKEFPDREMKSWGAEGQARHDVAPAKPSTAQQPTTQQKPQPEKPAVPNITIAGEPKQDTQKTKPTDTGTQGKPDIGDFAAKIEKEKADKAADATKTAPAKEPAKEPDTTQTAPAKEPSTTQAAPAKEPGVSQPAPAKEPSTSQPAGKEQPSAEPTLADRMAKLKDRFGKKDQPAAPADQPSGTQSTQTQQPAGSPVPGSSTEPSMADRIAKLKDRYGKGDSGQQMGKPAEQPTGTPAATKPSIDATSSPGKQGEGPGKQQGQGAGQGTGKEPGKGTEAGWDFSRGGTGYWKDTQDGFEHWVGSPGMWPDGKPIMPGEVRTKPKVYRPDSYSNVYDPEELRRLLRLKDRAEREKEAGKIQQPQYRESADIRHALNEQKLRLEKALRLGKK